MKKIEKLTPEQEAKIPEYLNRYVKIGLSCEPADGEKAKEWIPELYEKILERTKPKDILIAPSPKAAWEMICEREDVTPEDFVWPYIDGQFSVNYFAFYDFMKDELDVPLLDLYDIYRQSMNFGPIWPLDTYCIVSDRPREIHRNENGLHKDGGPAMRYSDDYQLWMLNGVRVPRWLAEKDFRQINAEDIVKIQNVEVRREGVRKLGVEKILKDLGGKLLDSDEERGYWLYDLNIPRPEGADPDIKYRYLKMKNPSTGTYHVEGVQGDTVRDAIHFRKPPKLRAIPIDDVNGEDWQQQGDVCIWNPDAKSVKFWPKVLT